MSDQNPPPFLPDNVLTRAYDAITGARATVSLPPPAAVIHREPAEPPGEPWDRPDVLVAPYVPVEASPSPVGPLGGFQGIDLRTNEIVGDNGEAFPLTVEEAEKVLGICFEIAERVTLARLQNLKARLGLDGPRPE